MHDDALRDPRRRRAAVAFGLVVGVPLVVGLLVAWAVYHALPEASGLAQVVLYWVLLSVVATLAARGFEIAATRLLPIRALLRLSTLLDDRRLAKAVRQGGHETVTMPAELRSRAEALLTDLGARDRRTALHARRSAVVVDLLAEEIGLGAEDRARLVWAARLHPVVENQRSQRSTSALDGPLTTWLGEYAIAIDQHAEHWDGSGGPEGLAGTEINLGARLLAVATVYDGLVNGDEPQGADDARQRLTELAGARLDPMAVRAFLALPARRVRLLLGPLATASATPAAGFIESLAAASSVGAPAAAAVGVGVLMAPMLSAPSITAAPDPPAAAQPTEPDPPDDGGTSVLPRVRHTPPPIWTLLEEPPDNDAPRPVQAEPATQVLGITVDNPFAPGPPPPPDDGPSIPTSDPANETPPRAPDPPSGDPVPDDDGPETQDPTPPPEEPAVTPDEPVEPPKEPVDPHGDELEVELTATTAADGTTTWTIVVTNLSGEDLTGVRILATPPPGGRDGAPASSSIHNDVGTLGAGESLTLTSTTGTGGPTSSVLVVTVKMDGAPTRQVSASA